MMKIKQIKSVVLSTAIAMGISVGLSNSTHAADYPEKPISLIIPLGAGGSHDLNARVMTSVIPTYLNQARDGRSTVVTVFQAAKESTESSPHGLSRAA